MKHYITLALALLTTGLFAQRGQLDNAMGLRIGTGYGISVQHFYSNKNVLEGILYRSVDRNAWSLTGMYEKHQQIFSVKGLKWYAGAGLHASIQGETGVFRKDGTVHSNSTIFIPGADGIIGLEYFFRGLPLQVSVDWKPEYNYISKDTKDPWYLWNSALTIRYRL
jgi:hypothetical protein